MAPFNEFVPLPSMEHCRRRAVVQPQLAATIEQHRGSPMAFRPELCLPWLPPTIAPAWTFDAPLTATITMSLHVLF